MEEDEATLRGWGEMSGTETESIASSTKSADRNRRKKDKKRASAARRKATAAASSDSEVDANSAAEAVAPEVSVEYVSSAPEEMEGVEGWDELSAVFSKFSRAEELVGNRTARAAAEAAAAAEAQGAAEAESSALTAPAEDAAEAARELSRRAKKRLKRLSMAELKQLVTKPEVVESWDVTADDPRLLVHLKSYRNTIPVPKHWAQKRQFLLGKRGIEKPPFQLPPFIAATGIEKIRAAVLEKENSKKLKGKMKERMQPKMGKIDIDYQVLHDAFFKFQTKPRLTRHGDVYYEGKEHEVALREKRPGVLSKELAGALDMQADGPPPWLVNMQRYGPPPSYANLKIPGLNAPIPTGTSYGYHAGGWGKPPVDEFGRPLYGDVFGTAEARVNESLEAGISREPWGTMEVEEDEDDDDDEEDGQALDDGSMTEEETNAGISSVTSTTPSGAATPDALELRKHLEAFGTPGTPSTSGGMDTPESVTSSHAPQLYQVLGQTNTKVGSAAFGSSHGYVIPGSGGSKGGGEGVDLALDPSELASLSEDALRARYDQLRKSEQAASAREDVSSIIEEQERKQRRKEANKR